ncbi:MAG: glycerol-3-phosphate 1-O-acyltransferase PlsY [Alphaproteobacteria bacterium]
MAGFELVIFALLGYLTGSIPFGLIITRIAGAGDIRAIGSGNIGATNVLRTGNKSLAALTLAGDMGKGLIPVLIAKIWWAEAPALAVAGGAFLGHLYPVWLRFKGGKGVATYIGVLTGVSWIAGLGFAGVWLAVAYISRYSSLAALTAAVVAPLILALLGDWPGVGLFTMLTALVFLRHHANIQRLMKGEESKIGAKKT